MPDELNQWEITNRIWTSNWTRKYPNRAWIWAGASKSNVDS